MPVRKPHTPSYRLHKPTGQAVVTIASRDYYLGKHGTPESHAEYRRLIAEWLASAGAVLPKPSTRPSKASRDLTVAELVLAFWRFVEGYYVKNDEQTSEVRNVRIALKPLKLLYGPTLARDFGPRALKVVREAMVESGLRRTEVNKRIKRVVRCFAWGVEEELVPPSVHHGLRAVKGLRKGRTKAPEAEPVRPVPDAHVEAIRPQVGPRIWAMIELQRLTGMRPGEVVIMRTGDLDRSGDVWVYTPGRHKAEHHGKTRAIYLGPRAQAVVAPWLRADPDAYLFSPAEAAAERNAARRAARKTPMTPSHRARRPKARPRWKPGSHYTPDTYLQAIERACARAGVPRWHPHQLRHNSATYLRREFGLDVARVILGHSSPAVTETYAELDRDKAIDTIRRVG